MLAVLLTIVVMAFFLGTGAITVAFFARWIGYAFKNLVHSH